MGLDRLSARSRWVRNRVESHPRLLVRDGVVDRDALRRQRTTDRELHATLRVNGARSVSKMPGGRWRNQRLPHDREPADEDLIAPIIEGRRGTKPERVARTAQ
jgi:hypothetical protein